MKHLLLIRHADAGVAELTSQEMDWALTELGGYQAQLLAKRLASFNVGFDALITSPLQRARQTADEIAKSLELRARVDERIYEIILGDDGQRELANTKDFLTDFLGGKWGNKVVVVCHGHRIRSFLQFGLQVSPERMAKFAVGNTSLTLLDYDEMEKSWYLGLLNDTAHLGGLKFWG